MAMFAFPLTFKIGLALVLSLALNVWLAKSKWEAAGEAKGAQERAQLQGEVNALERAQAVSGALAEAGRADHENMLAELEAIAARGRQTRVVYRTVATENPLADACKPGAQRVEAVNAGLR